jgi:CRP-like cAMP-binding protein
VISSLTAALASMNSKKELAGKQLDTIRNYLLVKGVPTDLRSRILEYYEYLFTSSQSLASSVRLEEMPVNLSAQLALSMNRKLAAKCAFFREVSNACMVTLMSSLVPRVFVPGQLICFEGHSLTEVYFINRGHVQLLERTINLGMLRDNDNFGLDDFLSSCLSGKPPVVRLTAKAITYCDVSYLTVETLNEALLRDETFQVRIRTGELGEKAKKAAKHRGYLQQLKPRSTTRGARSDNNGSLCEASTCGMRSGTLNEASSFVRNPKSRGLPGFDPEELGLGGDTPPDTAKDVPSERNQQLSGGDRAGRLEA